MKGRASTDLLKDDTWFHSNDGAGAHHLWHDCCLCNLFSKNIQRKECHVASSSKVLNYCLVDVSQKTGDRLTETCPRSTGQQGGMVSLTS